uniref:Complex 1 LYR protein domain-containing protein n=1 Tax=Plectus sambesii TaxID=2011161 RepID=A0A914XCL3_9BILA
MATITRLAWLGLYKDLQRASSEFKQFGYREFAKRRVREYFELNRKETDQQKLAALYQKGQETLKVIHRQAAIGDLFPASKLIIEQPTPAH